MIHAAGEVIYKYQLVHYVGGGNFGEVWKAKDISIDKECAIKLLDQEAPIDKRLFEAKIGSRLQHPNVVNIKYADVALSQHTQRQTVIIAMPFYSQGSVLSLVNGANFVDLKRSIKCMIDTLRGLEYLHENGYYHCDIKPKNILVGDNGEFLLTDYGITCISPDHSAVCPRERYLTHISPETYAQNTYDNRTDIYQMGLTAFRLINGISEIENDLIADQRTFLSKVSTGTLVTKARFNPYVPLALRRIITKATALNPDERYQTALDMRRAFESVLLRGNCTADEHGKVIIENNGYSYWCEVVPMGNNTFVVTYKKNNESNRITKVGKHSGKINLRDKAKVLQNIYLDLL